MILNGEGYYDPTAAAAIKEADRPPESLSKAIRLMKFAAECMGYEVSGRIALLDKDTGRVWR